MAHKTDVSSIKNHLMPCTIFDIVAISAAILLFIFIILFIISLIVLEARIFFLLYIKDFRLFNSNK